MGQKRDTGTGRAEQTVRDIRRATRRKFSAEEKIRIVLEGLRGENEAREFALRRYVVMTSLRRRQGLLKLSPTHH